MTCSRALFNIYSSLCLPFSFFLEGSDFNVTHPKYAKGCLCNWFEKAVHCSSFTNAAFSQKCSLSIHYIHLAGLEFPKIFVYMIYYLGLSLILTSSLLLVLLSSVQYNKQIVLKYVEISVPTYVQCFFCEGMHLFSLHNLNELHSPRAYRHLCSWDGWAPDGSPLGTRSS